MAKYEIETDQGKFEIETEEPSSDHPDFVPVGHEKSLAEKVSSSIEPQVSGPPEKEGFLSRLGRATKETLLSPIAPFMPSARRQFLNPSMGQYGLSRILEEEGKRVGNVVRASGENLGEKIATSPLANVSPELAAGTGAAASAAVDLASHVGELTPSAFQQSIGGQGAGEALPVMAKTVTAPFGKATAQVGKSFSGITANDYARMFKDPKSYLPEIAGGPKSIEKAGEAIGQATKAMRVSSSVDPLPRANDALKKAVGKVLEGVPKDISDADQVLAIRKNVERLSPQETYEAYRDASDLMKSAVEGKNKSLNRVRAIWVDALKDRLADLSGDYAASSKDFARAALHRTFTRPFPLTKYGESSIGRLGFSAPILGPLGYAVGGPVGAAIASIGGTSPLVHGAVTAGAGMTAKMAGELVSNPLFLTTLAGAARRRLNQSRKKK